MLINSKGNYFFCHFPGLAINVPLITTLRYTLAPVLAAVFHCLMHTLTFSLSAFSSGNQAEVFMWYHSVPLR